MAIASGFWSFEERKCADLDRVSIGETLAPTYSYFARESSSPALALGHVPQPAGLQPYTPSSGHHHHYHHHHHHHHHHYHHQHHHQHQHLTPARQPLGKHCCLVRTCPGLPRRCLDPPASFFHAATKLLRTKVALYQPIRHRPSRPWAVPQKHVCRQRKGQDTRRRGCRWRSTRFPRRNSVEGLGTQSPQS